MARLILWNMMTLDGFVEGPDHDIGWHEEVWGPDLEAFSIEQLRTAGGLLFGRRTYDLMAAHWPGAEGEVAQHMNALPKFVASRTLSDVGWENSQLLRGDVAAATARLKDEVAGDLFLFGSATLAETLMPHGLFDEFRIGVNPVVLGSGSPLFKPGSVRLRLHLAETRSLATGVVILRYLPET